MARGLPRDCVVVSKDGSVCNSPTRWVLIPPAAHAAPGDGFPVCHTHKAIITKPDYPPAGSTWDDRRQMSKYARPPAKLAG